MPDIKRDPRHYGRTPADRTFRPPTTEPIPAPEKPKIPDKVKNVSKPKEK